MAVQTAMSDSGRVPVKNVPLTATAAIQAAVEAANEIHKLLDAECDAGEVDLASLEGAVERLKTFKGDKGNNGSYWFESFSSFLRMLWGALTGTNSTETRAALRAKARGELTAIRVRIDRLKRTAASTRNSVSALEDAVASAAKIASDCLDEINQRVATAAAKSGGL